MKVKSTAQLERQIRILKREKSLLDAQIKEYLGKNRILTETNIELTNQQEHLMIQIELFEKRNEKLLKENKLLSAKNQLLESMKK